MIASVQPMTDSVGKILYRKVLYGSNKGGIKKGDVMFEQFSMGNLENHDYSGEHVPTETFDKGATDYTLAWTPVIPGSVGGTIGTSNITDDGNGNVLLNNVAAGTIDYETGKVTLNTAAANDVDFNYDYNMGVVPAKVPEVTTAIKEEVITAQKRALSSISNIFADFVLQNDFGVNHLEQMAVEAGLKLRSETDMEIIADMYNQGTAPSVTWNKAERIGVTSTERAKDFVRKLAEAGNLMYGSTGFAEPTFYIVGTDAAIELDSLDGTLYSRGGNIDPHGPYLAGKLQGKNVYKCPSPAMPSDGFLYGYRGQGLYDAGYVYAPYMPIMSTAITQGTDLASRQAYVTMYGKKCVCPAFYGAGKVVDKEQVVQNKVVTG